MMKADTYIFVLWGEQFEEAAAAIFVTELRQAGLRVKVVSSTRQKAGGAHGLALVPDLTLEQALPLASQTICVIIPCSLRLAQRLKNDPRFPDFLNKSQLNEAKFIIGRSNGLAAGDFDLFSVDCKNVTLYPENDKLIQFVRNVAKALSNAY